MSNKYSGDVITHSIFLDDCKKVYLNWNKTENNSVLSRWFINLFWSKTMCLVSLLNNEKCLSEILKKYNLAPNGTKFGGLNRIVVTNRNDGNQCYIYGADVVIYNINNLTGN